MATHVSTASKEYKQIHFNVGIYIARMSLACNQAACFAHSDPHGHARFNSIKRISSKSTSMLVCTLRECRWYTIKSHVLHTRSPWPRTFQQHQKNRSKSTSMLVFTLRGCRWHTIKSHAFPIVKIYNCLVGFARLSRVYARPSRGSRVDRYTPRSIMEHCGLSTR